MALLDTGLDNELMTLDTGFENSAMAAGDSDVQTFWVITSRAKGGANNPFGGSAGSNQTSQLVQMTEQDLYKEYQESGQLQDLFGSWDNYKGYVIESQDFIQTADWMTATPEYETGSKEWAFLNGEDLEWGPGEREKIQEKIIADRLMARTEAFNQWIGGEQGQALMQKYGIQPIIYNNDGDQFKWTGSGYQKTIKVDDHASFADYVKAALESVVVGGVTGGLANAAGNAFFGHGWSNVIGNVLGGGAGAGAGDVAYNTFNPNVIVNLAGSNLGDQGGNTEGDDNTTRYYPGDLPPGYIYDAVRQAVIHEASGAEYPVTRYSNVPGVAPYSWYVDLPPIDNNKGGGGGASTNPSSSNSNSNSNSSSNSGGTNIDDGTTSPQESGGDDNQVGGDIVGRQLHEAILRTSDPLIRGALIKEWEKYTGETYSDDYYGDKPFEPEQPREPIGHIWVVDDIEGGRWVPVYDETEIPTDAEYQQGATAPDGPPNADWALYCTLYPDDPACAKYGAVTGGGNTGSNSSSGGTNSGNNTSTNTSTATSTTPATTPSTTPSTTPTTTSSTGVNPAVIVGTGVWGTGTGGGTDGGGSGDGSGNGTGNGNGDGDGDGDGDGNGNGNGNGLSNIATRGSSKAHWDRLFATKGFESKWRQFANGGRPSGGSGQLQSPNFAAQDNTQSRAGLLSSMIEDLA